MTYHFEKKLRDLRRFIRLCSDDSGGFDTDINRLT
jgi:hypothetical protein